MTTRLLTLGGGGKPFSPNRLAIAAGRLLSILLSLYLLRATRTDNKIDEGLLLSVAVFVGLYIVFGRKGETRGVVLYLLATSAFAQIRLFADQTGIPVHYQYVIDIERFVFGTLPNHWLQEKLYRPGEASLITIYSASIYLSYFVTFQIVAFLVWLKRRSFFGPYATAIVVAASIGLVTCIVLPTAPPWLAGQEGHAPEIHRVVEQVLATHVDSNAYDGGASVAGVNQVAAMPSLHMALTLLVLLTVWHFSRKPLFRGLSVLYAASMAFALVYLGEHYVTDEFFGVLTAVAAWNVAMRLWTPEGRLQLSMPWKRQGDVAGSSEREGAGESVAP